VQLQQQGLIPELPQPFTISYKETWKEMQPIALACKFGGKI